MLLWKKSDNAGESTLFVEFMLDVVNEALQEMSSDLIGTTDSCQGRIQYAKQYFIDQFFSRKDYIKLFKNISSATASRDMKYGVLENKLKKYGERNQSKYKFK